MPLPMADFGFDLSNREIATLIYLSLLLASVLLWKEVRPLAFNVVRAFFMPQLALLWLLMSFYVAVCVLLLAVGCCRFRGRRVKLTASSFRTP